jgi:hypothetical protein
MKAVNDKVEEFIVKLSVGTGAGSYSLALQTCQLVKVRAVASPGGVGFNPYFPDQWVLSLHKDLAKFKKS